MLSFRRISLMVVVFGLVCLTVGCRSFTRPAKDHRLESSSAYWMDYDATRRGAIVAVKPDGTVTMLAEPSPDAAVELTQKYLAKLNYQGITGEASLDLAENIVQLGKRTTTIKFLRDSLYRLAELSNNGKLDAQAMDLFEQALEATLTLAQAELVQAESSKERAEARKLERLKELGLTDEQLGNILGTE